MSKKESSALIANIILVILGVLGIYKVVTVVGGNIFRYFTVDSNILGLLSSILFVLFMIMKRSQQEIPYFVMVFRYMASVAMFITFVVVFAYLAPVRIWIPDGSYLDNLKVLLLKDDMLYQHFLCPVISLVSFIFFEGDRRLNKKKTVLFSLLPTLVYGIPMLVMNMLNIVEGPYPFFRISEAPLINSIVMICIILFSYIAGRCILFLNQKYSPRRIRKK